jgi:hypothetical protein
MANIVLVLVAMALSALEVACGLGTYDDTGAADPGLSWPWVCPEGGSLTEDGCVPCSNSGQDSSSPTCDEDAAADGEQ